MEVKSANQDEDGEGIEAVRCRTFYFMKFDGKVTAVD